MIIENPCKKTTNWVCKALFKIRHCSKRTFRVHFSSGLGGKNLMIGLNLYFYAVELYQTQWLSYVTCEKPCLAGGPITLPGPWTGLVPPNEGKSATRSGTEPIFSRGNPSTWSKYSGLLNNENCWYQGHLEKCEKNE